MKIINGRYLLKKSLTKNKAYSVYEAIDMKNSNESVNITIIYSEFIQPDILKEFKNAFENYILITNNGIIKNKIFGIIEDNKLIRKNKYSYYYISESFLSTYEFEEYIKVISMAEGLKIFCSIAKVISNLHLSGEVYGFLTPNNILINEEREIKLKDKATVRLEKSTFYYFENNWGTYLAPEILEGEEPSIKSDIYSLGVILHKIINNSTVIMELDFIKDLEKCCKAMTCLEKENREGSLNKIITEINRVTHWNFKLYDCECLRNVSEITPLIGREEELVFLEKSIEDMSFGKIKREIIGIVGERGIGKTRLLEEIEKRAKLEGIETITSYIHERNSKNKIFVPIVRKLISMLEHNNKHLEKETLISILDKINIESERSKILYEEIDIIFKQLAKSEICVLLIDDIETLDEFSKKVIKYFYYRKFENAKIMIVFTSKSDEVVDTIRNLVGINEIETINLKNFSKEETHKFISKLTKINFKHSNIVDIMYKETNGNPAFIKSLIKEFYDKNFIKIHVDEDDGIVNLELKQSKISIPENLDEVFANSFYNLSKEYKELLKIMSLYKYYATIYDIRYISGINIFKIEKILDYFCEKKIIIKQYNCNREYYSFYNLADKKIVNKLINEKEKINIRRKIISSLNIYGSKFDESILKEELFYQYIHSLNESKALDIAVEYSKTIMDRDIVKALEFFIKANKIAEKTNSVKEIYIKENIAKLYANQGKIDLSIKHFESALIKAREIQCNSKIMSILESFIIILAQNTDLKYASELLKEMEHIAENNNLTMWKVKYLLCKAIYEIETGNIEEGKCICKKGIELSIKNEYLKARFYMLIANISIHRNELEQSESMYEQCIKVFYKFKDYNRVAACYNNLAAIYFDYKQENNTALKYFLKAESIAKRKCGIGSIITIKCNLAELYRVEGKRRIAKECIESALGNISIDSKMDFIYYYLKILQLQIVLNIGDYDEAYKISNELSNGLEKIQDSNDNMQLYYRVLTLYNLNLGNIKEAKKCISKVKSRYPLEHNISDLDCEYLKLIVEIYMDYEDINKNINSINEVILKYKNQNIRARRILNFILVLENLNLIKQNKSIIEGYLNHIQNDNSYDIRITKIYIEQLITDSINKKEECYILLSEEIDNDYDKNFYRSFCISYGETLEKQGRNEEALEKYLDLLIAIKNVVNKVPKEYKQSYLKIINWENILNKIIILLKKIGINNDLIMNLKENGTIETYEKLWEENIFENLIKIQCADLIKKEEVLNNIIKASTVIFDINTFITYIKKYFLCTSAVIVILNDNMNYEIACKIGYDEKSKRISSRILDRVILMHTPIVISKLSNDFKEKDEILDENEKTVAYIPIMDVGNGKGIYNEYNSKHRVNGIIYLQSRKNINSINKYTIEQLSYIRNLSCLIIENFKLKKFSQKDKLTGAYNRMAFEQELNNIIKNEDNSENKFALAIFDLDNFKKVNDNFGHQAGDKVLKDFVKVVQENISNKDIFCRYGGEEFIIIIPEVNLEYSLMYLEKIRLQVEKRLKTPDGNTVTVSCGVACYPIHSTFAEQLIEKADKALYKAKNSGKNTVRYWNKSLSDDKKIKSNVEAMSMDLFRDNQNVINFMEILAIFNGKGKVNDKGQRFLERLIRHIKAETAHLIRVNNEKIEILLSYEYLIKNKKIDTTLNINSDIINKVILDEKGICIIDWDRKINEKKTCEIPEWNSVICVPVFKKENIAGVLYFTVSTGKKEFDLNDYNIIERMSVLATNLL